MRRNVFGVLPKNLKFRLKQSYGGHNDLLRFIPSQCSSTIRLVRYIQGYEKLKSRRWNSVIACDRYAFSPAAVYFFRIHPSGLQFLRWTRCRAGQSCSYGRIPETIFRKCEGYINRWQWPYLLRCGSAAARFMGPLVRIPPGPWMHVSCECCAMERGYISTGHDTKLPF
jgi:hypothetical protein